MLKTYQYRQSVGLTLLNYERLEEPLHNLSVSISNDGISPLFQHFDTTRQNASTIGREPIELYHPLTRQPSLFMRYLVIDSTCILPNGLCLNACIGGRYHSLGRLATVNLFRSKDICELCCSVIFFRREKCPRMKILAFLICLISLPNTLQLNALYARCSTWNMLYYTHA